MQHRQHTRRKASIKQQQKIAKTAQKTTNAVQTFWKVKSGKGVFFTQQQQQGGPNGRSQTQKNYQDVWGPEGRGARRGGASSHSNSVGYQQILSLVEGQGVPINGEKMFLTFWKVKHCKGGRGSTVGGPKAAKAAALVQTAQAQAATKAAAAAANRNKNTSNKKNSNKQQNKEQHKQHKQPRKNKGQEVWVPLEFRCVRGFVFWMHTKKLFLGCKKFSGIQNVFSG